MSARLRALAINGLALVATAGSMLLAGCGIGTLATPSDVSGFKINGNVHGGAYPIQGATIRLMETASNGAWSSASDSYVGRARQILTTTSNNLGYFSFPDTGWSCTGGQYVYIQVTGGHTTAQTNANVAQIGVIGACSTTLATKSQIDNVNVFISELSTVAAAYTLNNFMSFSTDSSNNLLVNITAPANNNSANPGCTGSGSTGTNALTCVHAGLGHAFQNAYNLVDSVRYDGKFPTGDARVAVPGNAQSVIPQPLINTLGNILQSCFDSAGGTVASYQTYVPGGTVSTHCGDLFYWTTPPNSTTPPTNTLQAAINIAHYPTNNVDQIFKLQPRAVFFTPDMSSDVLSGNNSQLMAYTLSVVYLGTGLPNDQGMPYPVDLALDENDNVYVAYTGDNTGSTYGAVDEFTPNGVGVFAGPHQTTINNPASILLDANGYAWLSNDDPNTGNVYQIGTPASGGTLGGITRTLTLTRGYAAGLAADMANNIWVARDAPGNKSLFRFNAGNGYASDGFLIAPQLGFASKRIYVDFNQNVVGVSTNTSPTGVSNSTANAIAYLLPYAAYGSQSTLSQTTLNAKAPYALAMSNTDTVYIPLSKELDTLTGFTNGTLNSNGAGSYTGNSTTGSTYGVPMGIAMDGAGNLFWSDFETAGQIFWFQPSSNTSVSNGTLTSFFPCYVLNGQCYSNLSANLRGMAVDSSGSIWYMADTTVGVVLQTFGVGTPSYPLLSYARGGVIVQ